MEIDREKIMKTALFNGIQPEEMNCLLGCIGGYVKNFRKGAYISFEEDNIKNIGIVLSGTIHIVKEDIWGSKIIISRLAEGELFGEPSYVQIIITHLYLFSLRKMQRYYSCRFTE